MNPYKIKEDDIKAVEESIRIILNPKFNSIFPEGAPQNADILLFDSKKLLVFSIRKLGLKYLRDSVGRYKIYEFTHNKKIDECNFRVCGGALFDMEPKLKNKNYFFLPPITLFLQLQQKKDKSSPWAKRDGYIFSAIHEFGHGYYQEHSNLIPRTKELITKSISSYRGKKERLDSLILSPLCIHELFAVLTELHFSKALNSNYYPDIKRFILQELMENTDNHEYLCEEHNYAYALALMYLESQPKWYKTLLNAL